MVLKQCGRCDFIHFVSSSISYLERKKKQSLGFFWHGWWWFKQQDVEELKVEKSDILYFGDMTQPGGNDYPVVSMGIDTITVRNHEDTAFALRGILGVI